MAMKAFDFVHRHEDVETLKGLHEVMEQSFTSLYWYEHAALVSDLSLVCFFL
jgi:hypothetical protein